MYGFPNNCLAIIVIINLVWIWIDTNENNSEQGSSTENDDSGQANIEENFKGIGDSDQDGGDVYESYNVKDDECEQVSEE